MRALRLALVCLVLATPLAGAARAADVVISTGKKGGSYYGFGGRLETVLLLDYQKTAEVVVSPGSIENLTRLDDPESLVNVALTQADALARYLAEHPGFAGEFLKLADVGRECAFVVSGREGPIRTANDLKTGTGRQISLDDASSGASVTWENLMRLDPAYATTEGVFVDVMESLLQIKSGGGPLAAVMFVQRPLRRSPSLEIAFKHPDDYRFVPITGDDVGPADGLPELPDGSPVYSFEKVAVGGKERSGAIEIDTLCTRGLVLAAKEKLSRDLRSLLSQIMLERRGPSLIGKDE